MSESQPLAVPDSDPQSEPGQVQDSPAPRPGQSLATVPLILSLLALGLSIGLAVAAWFSWHELQQLAGAQSGTETRLESRLEPLRSSLDGVQEALRNERQQMERKLEELSGEQQRTGEQVSVLAALTGRSEQGWSLAEVEYLLRIANQRLQLQRDVKTAQQALRAADARLQELADPQFLKVREQLARELEALQAVALVDVDGISARLGALMELVDELTVEGSKYRPAVRTEADRSADAAAIQDWRELPALLWSVVSDLFRIREHDKPVSPMLPPEREYFLRENLRLQLSAARLALLRDDSVQYQATLATASSWLNDYFSASDARVKELLVQLEQLAAIDVAPQLPDVSASLRLLRQQLKLGAQQAVLPAVPAAGPADTTATETEQPSGSGDNAESAS
ncbi:MAG: uroporphyrinogen-III C-methyltransferase [Thiogranum sp.]